MTIETQEEENITQDDRKRENETQECDFKLISITGMMRNMSKTWRTMKLKNREKQHQKIIKRKKFRRTKIS